MQKLHNKGVISKLIICIIAMTMVFNFVMPSFAYATTDPENGGKLLEAIAKFFAHLCDKVMEWLQNTFVTIEKIQKDDGTYDFRYTPAIIFSGTVPALDINFINPLKDIREEFDVVDQIQEMCQDWYENKTKREDSTNFDKIEKEAKSDSSIKMFRGETYYNILQVDANGTEFYTPENKSYIMYVKEDKNASTANVYCKFGDDSYYSTQLDINELTATNKVRVYQSTAGKLQGTIASWYKALRRISLVGLLSVLVYIGIRIVLASSSPQDQSKYKKMIMDWVVAICLLFVLHYLMSLTLTVTREISKMFNSSTTDPIFNTLRTEIKEGTSWGAVTGEVIMYITLTVFTFMFTFQYLKRVIYMAFFTLIAPLITLTYPLDKIKDGQAQAFTMWIREYIFTALIQVVHLVIYFVLIGSALALVKNYPLYAIITLIFMKQAENIIKKMFGFDKAETVGTLGAATTGALVMNAINTLKRPSKSLGGASGASGGEGGANKGVRTASTKDPLEALRQNGEPAEREEERDMSELNRKERREARKQARQEARQERQDAREELRNMSKEERAERVRQRDAERKARRDARDERIDKKIKGVMAVGGRYVRPALGKAVGTIGSMAGGAIGFAAGASQGDIGKALTGLAAGGAAGYYGGQRATNAVFNTGNKMLHFDKYLDEIGDTYNKAALGEEAAQNIRFDREFKNSDAYRKLQANRNFSERNINSMLEAGITDEKVMDKILTNGGNDIEKEIGYYQLAKDCPDSVFYNKDEAALQKYIAVKLKENEADLDPRLVKEMADNMKKYK